MKSFLIPLLSVILAAGCSRELFINERLEVSCKETVVSGSEDTLAVKVSKDDWFIKYVCVDKQFYDGIVCEEGQLPKDGYMSLKGLGYIEWADKYSAFTVYRNAPDSLLFIFDGNRSEMERTVVVGIANEFENSVILIHQSVSRLYSIDTEWGFIYGNTNVETMKVKTLIFENDTDRPMTFEVNVFKAPKRIITYSNTYLESNPDYLSEKVDGAFIMEIPDPFLKKAGPPGSLDDRELLSFSGLRDTLRLGGTSYIPVELTHVQDEITVGPGTHKFNLYWNYAKYMTFFDLVVTSPSDREDRFPVCFTSWMPNGEWDLKESCN